MSELQTNEFFVSCPIFIQI